MSTGLWKIIDTNGTIHSGRPDEMDSAWDVMQYGAVNEYLNAMGEMDIELIHEDNIESLIALWNKYHCDFTGDLELIEVHKISR